MANKTYTVMNYSFWDNPKLHINEHTDVEAENPIEAAQKATGCPTPMHIVPSCDGRDGGVIRVIDDVLWEDWGRGHRIPYAICTELLPDPCYDVWVIENKDA